MTADEYHVAVLDGVRRYVDRKRIGYDDALSRRRVAILRAREAGLTLDRIAGALGVTRAAVIAQLRNRD